MYDGGGSLPGGDWSPTAHGSDQKGLRRRVARGLTWTLIDTWGSQLLALVIFALLAHILQPIDFGLVALAAVFVAFGQLFVDQGLGDAVIQRDQLTKRQLDTAFWATLLTGSLLAVAGILVAPFIATLLGDQRLEPIIQALSLVFVMVALSSIQMSLLRRELDFRRLAVRKLLAMAFGGVVGVAMALNGFGAWALVGQQLASALVSVIALWAVTPWRPGFSFDRGDFRSLFGFGIKVVSGDLLGFVSRNVDRLLIGIVLGPLALGFYAVAYRILDTSVVLLLAATRRLVFPTFARLQHDLDRVRGAYLRMSRASSALIVPGYFGLALIASEAIVVLFGAKWQQSVPAAAILFLAGPVLALQAFSGAVWNGVGQPGVTLRFRLITMLTNIAGFLIAIAFFKDILAMAAAFTVRAYVLLPLNLYWMQKYAAVPIRQQLWQVRGIFAATVVMAVSVLAVKLLAGNQLHPAALLAIEVGVGIAAFGLALVVFDRPLVREVLQLALQVIPGSRRIARRLGIKLEKKTPPAEERPQPTAPLPERDVRAFASVDESTEG